MLVLLFRRCLVDTAAEAVADTEPAATAASECADDNDDDDDVLPAMLWTTNRLAGIVRQFIPPASLV